MKNCLDIGIIQAFLDGELSGTEVTRVSDHIGDCDSCAMLLSQAEDENAVVFPALAREFDSMVPTQRLWARIEDSIEVQKASAPWWRKLHGIIVIDLINPQVGAFAALLIVVGLFAMYKLSGPAVPNDVAGIVPKSSTSPRTVDVITADPVAPATTGVSLTVGAPRTARPTVENASYRIPARQANSSISNSQQPVLENAAYLPGEESYVKTISSLSKTVNGDQDPNIMTASQQVSFARDMAVVDDTISRMRDAVKKNPKNDTAKQMLSTAYQNKIDLLNSVAQKQELVASLR
jgi:hypothetical protein